MKYLRQAKILELVARQQIETQEELSEQLKRAGFQVTQATVSRDIKELRLVKIQGADGRSRYSESAQEGDVAPKYRNILREAVLSVDFAGNIAVVKCFSGMGMAAATAIDAMEGNDVVGSIAGDDTILVVMRSEEKAGQFTTELKKMLGN